uniref:nicotinamide riboside transporter PnuC n=1 Tax=uncultured Streptococcus sp. TaxID=83427 RepID=UPI0028D387A2
RLSHHYSNFVSQLTLFPFNGVGQILMTAVYREQWIFWAATNVFSIYLWWGESLQIQGKYLIYLINSLVGWYQWSKAAKQNTDLSN